MLAKTVFFTFENIFATKIKLFLKTTYFFMKAVLWKKGTFPMEKKKNVSASLNIYNTVINFQHKIQVYLN